jgi:hypothetical protein
MNVIRVALLVFLVAAVLEDVHSQAVPKPVSTIAERTKGFKIFDGFFPFYWDESRAKVFLELSANRIGEDFILVSALATGIGSNDIGLDRGQLGKTRLVRFERAGTKVLLVEKNTRYRALTSNEAERRSVEEAFAKSVLYGFQVEAEDGNRILIDFTPFLTLDLHGVAETLRRNGQGTYRVDESRSALYADRTRNFPKNTEFEATVTYTGTGAGAWLESVVPSAEAVTVRNHVSLVALPDENYEPLPNDPRSGFFSVRFADYSTSIAQPLERKYAVRHRLIKKNPGEIMGEPQKPIVYYLDPGVPEPVRGALLDGARWWAKAFEAAGFRNAFRVEVLPDGVDPLDVRYNVIQWVHRSSRGWSYGASVIDPRTGEIIKGHVSLGSLRVRQDYLIFQGLLSPFDKSFDSLSVNPMSEAALSRIRQLSAHEVGHTLGLSHNYAASVNRRASVMDYPYPFIQEKDGKVDLSAAYATEAGAWDLAAIKWGYGDFAGPEDPTTARERFLQEDVFGKQGLKYLSDMDARPGHGAHPEVHQWDNGTDATVELDRLMGIRKNALARFSEKAVREGAPLTRLHDVFVPLYLMHRYQVDAAVKNIGGQSYTYALRGDGQALPKPVSSAEQRKALDALLRAVSPEALKVPEHVLKLIPPRVPDTYDGRELFKGRSGVTFDGFAPAEAGADVVWSALLHPARLERVLQQSSLRDVSFGAEQFQDAINAAVFTAQPAPLTDRSVLAVSASVLLQRLMEVSVSTQASPAVKGWALDWLEEAQQILDRTKSKSANPDRVRLAAWLKAERRRLETEPAAFRRAESNTPPGAPIGDCDSGFGEH